MNVFLFEFNFVAQWFLAIKIPITFEAYYGAEPENTAFGHFIPPGEFFSL
jgi:hypothetical protein